MPITIEEEIKGSSENTPEHAITLTGELGIGHIIRSFKDEFETTLDALTREKENRACTLCGVLRKNILNKAARELGANKIAIGHNLSDESQTILMNYMRGDIDRLKRMIPGTTQKGMVPR